MITNNTIDPNLVAAIESSAKMFPSILRVGVFGSHARGEYSPGSDIDILYDYDDSDIDDMLSFVEDMSQRIENNIDFVAYYLLMEDDMNESEINFRDTVLNEVVWVYEKKV